MLHALCSIGSCAQSAEDSASLSWATVETVGEQAAFTKSWLK
jgi:hypothetical protein